MKTHRGSLLTDHEVLSPQVRLYRERSQKRMRRKREGGREEQTSTKTGGPATARLESQHQFFTPSLQETQALCFSYSVFSIPNIPVLILGTISIDCTGYW